MNRYLHDCLMHINPSIKDDEIEDVKILNDFDILFIFKNGEKILFDSDKKTHRGLYPDDYVLSDEQRKKEFRDRLRTIMNRKGITQEELANRLGTTQTVISRYINGITVPNYVIVEKIAEILNCSTDDFRYKHY